MDGAGGEIGDHLTARTIENRDRRDTDEVVAILLSVGIVDLEFAVDLDVALISRGARGVFRRKPDDEGHLPVQGIVGESGNLVLGFECEGAAGLFAGGGMALEGQEAVIEQRER